MTPNRCRWRTRDARRRVSILARPGAVRRAVRSTRRGFTLVEVLLVANLSVVLLSAVWSLFGVYVGLFNQGQDRTEQTQLVRSLMRQISDDLRGAIQDTASRPPQTPATTPLRRFGLFGTDQSLQVDIMHVAPAAVGPSPAPATEPSAAEETPGPKAPEFRTVQYEFVAPPESSASPDAAPTQEQEANARVGLVRHELNWEIPGGIQESGTGSPQKPSATTSNALAAATTFGSVAGDRSLEASPVDDTSLYIPEVVSLGFRYFDGKGWNSQWNSIERKSLPAAIEITLQIRPPASAKPRRFEESESSAKPDTSKDEKDDSRVTVHDAVAASPTEEKPPLPTHRMVVYLPVSPLQSPPKAASADSPRFSVSVPSVRVPSVAVPPVVVPPVPLGRGRDSVSTLSDQHMRSQ